MTEWFERAFPDPAARQTAIGQFDRAIAALENDPSRPQIIEWTVMCRDGALRVLHNQISKIGSYFTFIYRDIREQWCLEDRLRVLASTDMLIGVYNRRHFFDEAEAILASAETATAELCKLVLDNDHVKSINDTFGHQALDQAPAAVATPRSMPQSRQDETAWSRASIA
jgi:predicted signal transduction protein with EAL and GGDEF domain